MILRKKKFEYGKIKKNRPTEREKGIVKNYNIKKEKDYSLYGTSGGTRVTKKDINKLTNKKPNTKPFDFIGKEQLLKIKDKKLDKRFVMLCLKSNKPGYPLLLHEEPIYLNNKIIGKTTSGNFSFNYNKNISFGYISSHLSNIELNKMEIFIEIEKKKYQAEILLKPLKQTNFKKI